MFENKHVLPHLQVFNVVPSISAVTGISPGRYLWRVVIAFHLGPRLLIVSTYYHFLLTFLETAAKRQERKRERTTTTISLLLFLGPTNFTFEVGNDFITNCVSLSLSL